ncbi:MaoC/PaaZ C-terminal domain-containing protein [Streptomyces sp. NPDC051985]|uniref:MaoC/PaaZ C-terminal domain-containing protein n=1 Tax=Streptomyces sp. NPDC051985 TaxID=3155807 RepID=UPI00341E7B87
MPVNPDAVGLEWDRGSHSWTSNDTILYALGVGAGADDPLAELAFTTENSHGVTQQVLPTFAVMLGGGPPPAELGELDLARLLHADQSITLHGPLPVTGTATTTARIAGVYDKGSGALVVIESSSTDSNNGQLLAETRTGLFLRGEGGFGGDRGPSERWAPPARSPDHVVACRPREDQALLYRLSGDRNPLHSDPWLAARAGFDRPILHGLCTYGFTGRALLHAVCDSDPASFGGMSARFAAPVLPGQGLSVRIWDQGDTCLFQTYVGDTVVLDRGTFTRKIR